MNLLLSPEIFDKSYPKSSETAEIRLWGGSSNIKSVFASMTCQELFLISDSS